MTSKADHPSPNRGALTLRVRKVAGQLRTIEKMIEEDCDCADILTQLVSARRGLKSLAETLIQSHLRHCVGEAKNIGEAQQRLSGMLSVLERYVE